ncbi:MAG: cysteine desulfurase NifS [Clostridium sp. CAG:354_28_25]|nr:MAG: cysteine desulfurase NifS [Clostridium sp. CAG:354_28_25]
MKTIYFDHAATTAVAPEVKEAMEPYFCENYGNASSLYELGYKSKEAINIARVNVAKAINAKPNEIYFTSCGSESDNLAIKGVVRAHRQNGNHIITSRIEHPAVLNTCRQLEKEGFRVTYLNVDKNGFIDLEELKNSINSKTILVSIMFANNEVGTIEPIKEISRIVHSNNAIFHTDAVQAVGNIKIDVKEMGIDLLSMSAHKFYGPKGVGALYVRDSIDFIQLQNGGHQENDKRAGTENVAGIVGLGKAIEIANDNVMQNNEKLLNLRNYCIEQIKNRIPYIRINGDLNSRLLGNINISFLYVNGKDLVKLLAKKGICTSSGSACSSGLSQPSHVLLAMGLSEDIASSALRITLGKENTKEDIDYFVDELEKIVVNLRTERY